VVQILLDAGTSNQPPRRTPEPRPAVEQALMRDCSSIVGSNETPWASNTSPLAADVDAVRTALVAHYGDDLIVLPSRWTTVTLQHIERDRP
jgi:hypothetical protein